MKQLWPKCLDTLATFSHYPWKWPQEQWLSECGWTCKPKWEWKRVRAASSSHSVGWVELLPERGAWGCSHVEELAKVLEVFSHVSRQHHIHNAAPQVFVRVPLQPCNVQPLGDDPASEWKRDWWRMKNRNGSRESCWRYSEKYEETERDSKRATVCIVQP